jgi:AraC-like DNA-binding protein
MASRHQSYPDVVGTPLSRVVTHIYAIEEEIDPGTVYPPQRVRCLSMLLTKGGEARVDVDGKLITHRPGTIVVYAQGARIQETAGKRLPWHVRYLMVLGPWASVVARQMTERNENVFVYDPAPQRWQRLLSEAIDFAFMQSKGWQWMFASRLSEFAGVMTQHPSPPGEPKGMLERLETLIDRAPERSWRMSELCQALGVSASTLSHRFREIAGEAPATWVRRRRLEVARRMLQQGLSVVQVSERLGFANPFHFSRAFKSFAGVPPSNIKATPLDASLHPAAPSAD